MESQEESGQRDDLSVLGPPRMRSEEPIRALGRGLAVLEALNQDSVMSLARLHQITGLPKPSLWRLLETLIDAGYVARVSRRDGYALTEAVLRLTSGLRHRDVVVDVARSLMEGFTRRYKWQVSLATAETDSMLVRFSTRHISPFAREQNFLNRRVHMLRSAVGRAYFAHCAEDEREFVLSSLRASHDTMAIKTGAESLADLIAQVRADGYATADRLRSDPIRSFAVPVMRAGVEDSPVGAIAVFYYRTAMTEPQALSRYLPVLRALADDIAAGPARARVGAAPHLETRPFPTCPLAANVSGAGIATELPSARLLHG